MPEPARHFVDSYMPVYKYILVRQLQHHNQISSCPQQADWKGKDISPDRSGGFLFHQMQEVLHSL